MIDRYTQDYLADDPRMKSISSCTGRAVPCYELVDVEAFERSEIVNEFLDSKDLDLR